MNWGLRINYSYKKVHFFHSAFVQKAYKFAWTKKSQFPKLGKLRFKKSRSKKLLSDSGWQLCNLNFVTCISHKLQYLFKSRQTLTEVAKVCNLVFFSKRPIIVYFWLWLWIWFDRALKVSLCLIIYFLFN